VTPKKSILVLRHCLALTRNWRDILVALKSMRNQVVLPLRDHLGLTADGLLNASRQSPDGGYAMGFSLLSGWQRGYVETTGYIIPTVLDLAKALDRPELRADALKNGEWLLSMQLEDGAFPDLDRKSAEIFDTGQVLMGLQRLRMETNDERYRTSGDRAAGWLFKKFAAFELDQHATIFPTYLTRSASALIDYGATYNHPEYVEAGCGFLEWVAHQILPSGVFRYSQLGKDEYFLLHTMIYVLEGFLHAHAVLGDQRWLTVTLRGAEALKKVNLEREIILFSYYDADLRARGQEKCLTGLSQWAGVCLRLFELTGDEAYRECASNSLFYVKSKQIQSRGDLRGAIPGSVPVWGRYLRMAFPNWNLKFFGDALLKWWVMGLRDETQQEVFVKRSHAIYARKIGWTADKTELSSFDIRTSNRVEEVVCRLSCSSERDDLHILDLGCGEGRFMTRLQDRHPSWTVTGVDPISPTVPRSAIVQGTATQIPFPNASFDGVYAIIALQHVSNVEASLVEVKRVLRPDGIFIVFERNLVSLRGIAKPWHEVRGRWLYSWDSPFRERWYALREWRAIFRRAGFRTIEARSLAHSTGQGFRKCLPINRFVFVAGQKPNH
jgi:ubiquinone/menaquinone biosynthesis C-methylase UbiE